MSGTFLGYRTVGSLRVYLSGFYSHSHSDPLKISTEFYPIKPIFLQKICQNSLSVNMAQQTAKLQKGYSAYTEGKNQCNFSRITLTVTVKVTEVNT